MIGETKASARLCPLIRSFRQMYPVIDLEIIATSILWRRDADLRFDRTPPGAHVFGLVFRFKFTLPQTHRSASGSARFGVTYSHDLHLSQRRQSRRPLNAATTGWKSFFPKLAHSL